MAQCVMGACNCQPEIYDRYQGLLTEDHDDTGSPSEYLRSRQF